MPEGERTTRRRFLETSAMLAAGGLLEPASLLRAGDAKDGILPVPSIGVCTSVKNAQVLKQAGASFIEEGVRWFLVPDKPDADFAPKLEAARASAVPVKAANCFLPGSLKSVGADANHEGVLAYAETAFQRAKQAGIETIVFGSSGSRAVPEGFSARDAELQFVALLAKMAPLAEADGVTVVVEPLNKGEVNFINTLLEGARLVEPVAHPNIRLLADIFHMMRMDEPASHIHDVAHLLHHVHIAEKAERTPPGAAGDDFKPYLAALAKKGYKGPLSIECRWKDLAVQLPKAVETIRTQWPDA
jgi:sugar phosphate isomerase/epimerase